MNTDDFQQVKKGMIKRTFLVIFQIFCYLCATLLASLKDYPVLNHHDSNRIIFNDAQAHNNFKNSFLMSIFYLINRLWNTYVNTIKKYKGLVILYLAIPIFLVRKDKHNEYFITFIPLLIYILLHYMLIFYFYKMHYTGMKLCLTIQPNIIYQLYDELSLFICIMWFTKKLI